MSDKNKTKKISILENCETKNETFPKKKKSKQIIKKINRYLLIIILYDIKIIWNKSIRNNYILNSKNISFSENF